jgi:hypothetical protein
MDYLVRPATLADKTAIAPFVTDTFDWGDYVQDRYEDWLTDKASYNAVAVHDGAPIGFGRGLLSSPTELWMQSARVHPEHRGNQLNGLIGRQIVEWASIGGARVARLLIEDRDTASKRSVVKMGYREVSQWYFAVRDIINRDPQPTGNGGKRVRGDERLRPASTAETEPAFMAWSTSDLMRASRSLFTRNWVWRKLVVTDLEAAAKEQCLYESASGWAIITYTAGRDMTVSWMMSNPDDTFRLIRAILDRGVETDARGLQFFLPSLEEVEAALTRIGCTIKRMSIWEKAISPSSPERGRMARVES